MSAMAEIYPLQILIASLAGWMNRRQGEVLEYLYWTSDFRSTFGSAEAP